MAAAYVVLAPSTPPDSAKPVAVFIVGATQNTADAQQRANEFKANYQPTGTVQPCTIDNYNTNVAINP